MTLLTPNATLTNKAAVLDVATAPSLRLVYRVLEPRMVFDGALLATVDAAADHAAPHSDAQHPDAAALAHSTLVDALHALPPAAPVESVVFIDSRVQDYQRIVADLAPGSKVVLLTTESGGLEQIAAYLNGHTYVDSIHILSHGASGMLQLGSDVLTSDSLSTHTEALAGIGHALRKGGDILIYGCDVAEGSAGDKFISTIAKLTGDDIAASTNLTGAASRLGDWVLEKHTGTIEAMSIQARDWDGTLAVFSINAATAPVLTTGTHVGGPLNGDTATYKNVGTAVIGGVTVNINLVGTITSSTVGDTIGWGNGTGPTGNNTAAMTMGGGADGGQVTVHWALYVAGTTPANSTPFFADIKIAIGDIDGTGAAPNGANPPPYLLESVSASQTGLLTYSVANPTDLVVTSTAGFIRADGTISENGTAPSIIQYSWLNSSNWDITYFTAPGASGRQFQNDGSGTYTIPGAVTVGSLLDLDGNNSTATGFNYQNTFVENGAGVPVVDTDATIRNIDGSALSPTATFTAATIVLTNAQATDQLLVGTLPAGISFTVSPLTGGKITVTLSGTDTAANYLSAMQAITFKNTSDTPVTTDRVLNISIANGTTLSNPTTSTIHVTAVNDAPVVANPGAQTTLEDTSVVFSAAKGTAITVSDVDAGAAGLETVMLSVAHGTLTLGSVTGLTGLTGNGTGTISFTGTVAQVNTAMNGLTYLNTPDYNSTGTGTAGPDTLTISVKDDGKDSGVLASNGPQIGSGSVDINITAVADITNDAVSTPEDTPLTFNAVTGTLGATVDSFENPTHPVTSVTQGANGTVTFLASGAITYTPNTNFNGPDSFTYTVTSGGVTETATVNVTVTAVNDAPVTSATAAQTVSEDTTLMFSAANSNLLSISDIDAGATGLETVTLTVTKGTINLGSTVGITGLTGNGTATVSFTGTLAQVNAAIDGLTYQGNTNVNGSDTLTITVKDDGKDNGVATSNGALSAVVKTVPITILPVNDAPAGADKLVVINEDTPYTFAAADFGFTDIDANSLQSVIIATLPAATDGVLKVGGVAVTAGQELTLAQLATLTFTPATNLNGANLGGFTFQVRDNGGIANGGVDLDPTPNAFKFNIAPVNDVPVTSGPATTLTVLEDTPLVFSAANNNALTVSDIDAGASGLETVTLTVTKGTLNLGSTTGLTGISGNGSSTIVFTGTVAQVNAAMAGLAYQGNANANGTDTLTIKATDDGKDNGNVTSNGVLSSTLRTVAIAVKPVNDAPVTAIPTAQTVAEDTALVFSSGNTNAIVISDVDASTTGVETVTLSVAHGTLTLGTTAGLTGLSGNNSGTIIFTGTLAQVNAAIAGLKYQGTANYNGPDLLTIQVKDDGTDNGVVASNGALSSIIQTIPITVTPVNDPPVANTDTASTNEDTPITIPAATLLANDTDVDGNTLTITSVQAPVNGTVTLDLSGNPVFTPNPNYFGPASFTYTISDGNGGVSTATVNLTIVPVNDAPVAANDAYGTGEKTVLTVPLATGLLANDTDIDTAHAALTVSQVNGVAMSPGAPIVLPSGAILTPNADGTFSYDPNGAFNSLAAAATTTDSFSYQVSDGQGGLATATATITITGVNDAPVANPDTNSTNPHVPISVGAAAGLLANDTDAEHDVLTVSKVNNVAIIGSSATVAGTNGGTFTINTDGSYTFNPGTAFDSLPIGASATSSVSYTVSDGHGGFSTTTLTVSVPYTNLPPIVAQPLPLRTSLDGAAVSIPVTGVFADPNPSDTLTITATGLPSGLNYNPVTGAIEGTLAADASQHAGPYTITLSANDGHGGITTSTFQLNVGNPPPVAVNDVNSVIEHGTTTGAVLANDHDGGADSDPLSVTLINGATFTPGGTITLPSGGQLVMTASGAYSYDPHGAFNGLSVGQTATDTFSYQVGDGQGGFATATVTITINGQNEAPVIVDPANPGTSPADPNHIVPAQTGLDGTAITPLSVKGFFADPDKADTLTLSVTGALPPGVTFNAAAGIFSGTPTSNASQGGPANNGVYSVLVVASDGNGGTVSTTVTFTIGNPAPVAQNDSATVQEHGTVSGNVVANDHDGGGDTDPLAVTLVNGQTLAPGSTITLPSGAQLVMAANGTYTYNPNGAFASLSASQTATDSFTYQISDGQGGVSTATATIVIQGQNDAPVANLDNNTTNPQVAISVLAPAGVLANDTDAEHDLLTVTAINGTAGNVGAAVTGSNGGTFNIAADGSYTFDPGHAFDSLLPGASASTSVSYTISDGHGGFSTTTLTISVPFTNLPPVVNQPIAAQNSSDGNPVSIPLTGVFADPNPGDALTITATGLPPGLSYNPLTGAIEGTLTSGASQHSGPYLVTLTAKDPSGSTVTSTFNFNVANVPPVAVNDVNTVAEHGTASGAVLANDHDGGLDHDTLTVSQINNQAYTPGGTVTLPSGALLVMQANGTYTYDPNSAFNGLSVNQTATDSFTYQVSDGQGGYALATVSITITGQNEAPFIVDPAHPGTPIDPNHVVPAQTAIDGTAIVPLTVKSFFADPDKADTLTLLPIPAAALPPGISFDPATGTFSGTPTAAASQGGPAGNGFYNVVVTASDGNGGFASTTVTFTIGNAAPVATPDSTTVAEHATTAGNVLANDHDGGGDTDPLSVTQINGTTFTAGSPIVLPSGALLTMNPNGTYVYDPNGAFASLQVGQSVADTFSYQISDGQGGFSTATVTVVISGQNDNPTANPDVNTALPQTSISVVAPLGLLANDTDPEHDVLTVSAVNGAPAMVGVTIPGSNGGTFTIQPDGSYTFNAGTDFDSLLPGTKATTSITYTVSDGHGGTSSTTLTISVPYANLPPVVNQPVPGQQSLDGDTVSISLNTVFKDPNPGDTLTITTSPLPLGLTYNPATNAIEGTLSASASQGGPYAITLTAKDSAGNAVSTSFDYAVSNPPPAAMPDSKGVLEHGTTTGAVLANDHDGANDSDPLSVTQINGAAFVPGGVITLPSGAHLVMAANGNYTYDPNGAFNGLALNQTTSDNFTYQISDGQGGFSTATVSIVITGQNEAPVVVDPANPGVPADPNHVIPSQPANDGSSIAPLDVRAYFADPDNSDVLSYSVPASALPPGVIFDAATGTFSGTPTSSASQGGTNLDGTYPIVVTAIDSNGATVTTTVIFQIANPAPVASNDSNTVLEHGTTTGTVLGNDHDGGADTDPLAVTQVNGATIMPGAAIPLPSGALLTMDALGQYTYNPNGAYLSLGAGQTATDSFTYQVSDGQGGFATATVFVVVTGQNDAPVVVDPAHPGAPPADPMHLVPVQNGSDGAAIAPLSVITLFKDPDNGDSLTLSVPTTALPPGISFDPATGTFSGTPTAAASQGGPNGNGVYAVTVTATDSHGATVTTIVTFSIGNVPPVATPDSNTVQEHGTTSGAVLANDHDGGADTDPLSVSQINGVAFTPGASLALPSGATLVMAANGTYSYDPNGQFNGLGLGQTASDSFTYQVSDGNGGFATATVTITIVGQNDAPLVVDPTTGAPVAPGAAIVPAQSAQDGAAIAPLTISGFFTDPDSGDMLALTVPANALPAGVTFDPASGTFSGTPTSSASQGGPASNGIYPVAITATDSHGSTVTTIVTFTIGNPPPVAAADILALPADQTGAGTVLANDHDGASDSDPLTVTEINGAAINATGPTTVNLPSGAILTINPDGTYSYNPNGFGATLGHGQQTTDSFTYKVSDGQGGFDTASVTITVNAANAAPVVVDPAHPGMPPADPMHVVPVQSGSDGSAITPIGIAAYFADPNAGDVLTFSVPAGSLPAGLTFDPTTGTFAGTPGAAASQSGPAGNGTYPIVVTANDGYGGMTSTIVTMVIANVSPVAANDSVSVPVHGAAGAGNVLANDHDGGSDSDPLQVSQVNGQALVPGATLSLPSGALLVMNADGSYTYDPNGTHPGLGFGQTATDSFSYQVSDGNGGFATATVNITLTGVNDSPVVVDPAQPGTPPIDPLHIVATQSGADGSPITPLNMMSYFTDPNTGDTLVLSVNPLQLPVGIAFDVATGTFSGTADPSASQGGPSGNGVYPIVVSASDGHGGTVSTIVVFQIANPAPVASNDSNTVLEHGTTTGAVLTNDHDGGADTDPLAVTLVNGATFTPGAAVALPSGALLTMDALGQYTYNPNGAYLSLGAGQTATDSFTYQVSDGQGGFATATVFVVVTGQNDAPVVVDPAHPGVPPADPMHLVPVQNASDGAPIVPITVAQLFKDPDTGDLLTLSVDPTALPPGIAFDPVTGTFIGVAGPGASGGGPLGNGVYPIVVTADDGHGGTVTTIVTFTFTNVAPVAINDTLTANEHAVSIPGNVLTNDHDGGFDTDPLAVTQVNGAALVPGGTIALPSGALLVMNANGSYDYQPNGAFQSLAAGEAGSDAFTYQISDGQGGFATAQVTITVVGENDPPVVIDPAHPGTPPADPQHLIPTVAGQDGTPIAPVSVGAVFHDPDASDKLVLSIPAGSLPPGIVFNPATGVFSGAPTASASQGGPLGDGVYPIVVTASDGHGGTVTTTVTFTFSNPAPVAADNKAYAKPDSPVTIPVLNNDHDGGSDSDPLTVTQASSPDGTVTVNPDGTLTFQPASGFVGLATITYTISDGQGGFSTAKALVLVAPDIHTMAPAPIVPPTTLTGLPSNTGITADPAVVAAVHDAGTLNSIADGISAQGIVVATANQIGNLGGLSGHTVSSTVGGDITGTTKTIWQSGFATESHSARATMLWQPEGLTGFSLRSTFAMDSSTGREAQVVVESLVRDRSLILRLSSTEVLGKAHVVDYSVELANGQALPRWLSYNGQRVVMGERPADVERIELHITATLSDGSVIERDVVVQTNSGEIKPLTPMRRSDVVPLFTDQLRQHAAVQHSHSLEFSTLLRALTG